MNKYIQGHWYKANCANTELNGRHFYVLCYVPDMVGALMVKFDGDEDTTQVAETIMDGAEYIGENLTEKEYTIEARVVTPQYLKVKAKSRKEAIRYADTYDGPDWEIGDEEPRELVHIN